ncbi:MAG: hypothetical protein DWQ07_03900 [Chloroflexi bacterium]|nr:MAG: hypothetical protein DWQ07_03900 [Chloroflexota bacterium]MBL1193354.1 hypothetical protein [Chloroflexota bacterium]
MAMSFKSLLGRLLIILVFGISACQSPPVQRLTPQQIFEESDLTTGIQGLAEIQTRLSAEDTTGPSPYKGAIFVYEVEGESIGQFFPDEHGLFKVALPPGEYRLVADQPLIRNFEYPVVVPAQGFLEIDLLFEIPLT